jgi:hypothetical protein
MSYIGESRPFVLLLSLVLLASFQIMPVFHLSMNLPYDMLNVHLLSQGVPHSQILIMGDSDFATRYEII